MTHKEIIQLIEIELGRARKKWPKYYGDVIHAVAVVIEESGEAMQAALNYTYDNGRKEDVQKELVQTAAMCVRALENLDELYAAQQQIFEK